MKKLYGWPTVHEIALYRTRLGVYKIETEWYSERW